MADKKLAMLIQRLHEKTNESKISWEKTAEEDAFQVSFSDYSVVISKNALPLAVTEIKLTIVNQNGEVVDEITSSSSPLFKTERGDDYLFQDMTALHHHARRSAMGIEKAVDSLLSALAD